MDFWQRVKAEIKRQNTTQEWVARRAGIILGSFRGWIAKDRLPDVKDGVAIAGALGVTVEYLLTGEKNDIADWESEVLEWAFRNRKFVSNAAELHPSDFSIADRIVQLLYLEEINNREWVEKMTGKGIEPVEDWYLKDPERWRRYFSASAPSVLEPHPLKGLVEPVPPSQ